MGTHCSSELHRGHIQVKKTTTMKLRPRLTLNLHPLLKLLPLLMLTLSIMDLVFPLFLTIPTSNGLESRPPFMKELPGVSEEKGLLRLMPNLVITDTPMVITDILIMDTVPVTTSIEVPKALASKCNVAS